MRKKRVSAVNAKRKLHHAQAVLLGVEITHRPTDHGNSYGWYKTVPNELLNPRHGYVSGPYKYRWQVVESVMELLDL